MAHRNYWSGIGTGPVSRRTVLRGAAVGGTALAAAALIGCDGGQATKPAPSGSPAASGATAAPAAPKPGGRLAVLLSNDPATFDNHTQTTINTNYPVCLAYNQLVQLNPTDGSEKPNGIISDLAEKWEIAPDGMTYTFQLVKNAKFHDGTPFTSEDVKASLLRNQSPPKGVVAPRQLQFAAIKSFETPDASTFIIKLSRPMSRLSLLPILGQGFMSIYSKKDIDGNFDYKTKMNGTGAYRLKEFLKGNRVVFDRNKDYFVKDRPYMDGVDIFIVPDDSTALANTQSGALDFNNRPTFANLEKMKQAMGDKATYQSVNAYKINAATMNARRAPWKDDRVRLAIAMAVDKGAALKILEQGDGNLGGFMPPGGTWALSAQELGQVQGYQPYSDAGLAEAKKMLSAAGVPDGFAVKMLTRDEAAYRSTSVFMVEQLAKLGMKATPDIVSAAESSARQLKNEFELQPSSSTQSLDDPDAVFAENYLTDSTGNATGIGVKAVDDLFLKQSTEQDQQKRSDMVKEMQKLALAQNGRVVFYWYRRHAILSKRMKNYVLHSSNLNNNRYQDVWLDA